MFHYAIDNKEYNRKLVEQRQLLQSPCSKKNIQNLDSYNYLIFTLTRPDLDKITAVILIDESLRRELGKLHTLKLIQQKRVHQ
jgi:fructose-bisphosphate aldolase class 1